MHTLSITNAVHNKTYAHYGQMLLICGNPGPRPLVHNLKKTISRQSKHNAHIINANRTT